MNTHIAMVLDRSGSMESCRESTIEAVNKYLLEARADDALKDASFELMIFDSNSIDVIRSGKPTEVKDITHEDFVPRGGTPLYDAIGRAADSLDANAKDGKAILVVVTDGQENASRKHTHESITAIIKTRQDKGWLIVFLGAGLGAAQQGTAMGIRSAYVANIGLDKASLGATMTSVRGLSAGYASTRCMADASAFATASSFSAKDRVAMGDATAGAGLVGATGGLLKPKQKIASGDAWGAQASGDAWK